MSRITLDTLAGDFNDQRDRARALRAAYTDVTLMRPPAPGKWSAVQCISHLVITQSGYEARVVALIERTRRAGRTTDDPHIRLGWFAGQFVRFVSPQSKRKLRAPRIFRPPTEQPVDLTAFDDFDAGQSRWLNLIESSRGLELNGLKLASPVSRLIRFTLGESLVLMCQHQARHLNQAEAAARQPQAMHPA